MSTEDEATGAKHWWSSPPAILTAVLIPVAGLIVAIVFGVLSLQQVHDTAATTPPTVITSVAVATSSATDCLYGLWRLDKQPDRIDLTQNRVVMPVTSDGSINFRFDDSETGGVETNLEIVGDYQGSVAKQEVHGTDSFTYTHGHGAIVFTHGEDRATQVTTLGDQQDSSGPWTAHYASAGYTCSDTKLTLNFGGADGTIPLCQDLVRQGLI